MYRKVVLSHLRIRQIQNVDQVMLLNNNIGRIKQRYYYEKGQKASYDDNATLRPARWQSFTDEFFQ